MEGKTKASQRAIASASEATRKLNPHLFYGITGPTKVIYDDGTEYKPKTRIRQDKPMNRLEREAFEYIKFHYQPRQTLVRAQSIRFRLANGLWYKPDITSLNEASLEVAWEVKGPHAFRGGFENLKMAATQYPEIRWILMWKDQGQWQFQEVLP